MVKLLNGFPNVHQNFNLGPVADVQIQKMRRGRRRIHSCGERDAPAKDLSLEERRFALQYLFQGESAKVIRRYPRYRELWERVREHGYHPEDGGALFHSAGFYRPAGVVAVREWFDEYFLEEKDVTALDHQRPQLLA